MTVANDRSNMAKSGLGRGLQHLMKDRPASIGPENSSQKVQVTPGMAALLRGGNGEGNEPESVVGEDRTGRARKRILIQASLFVADLLVIGLVARLTFVSHGQFGLFEVTLSILALTIGAWLSCLALWLK
jgi:hypothetical protein